MSGRDAVLVLGATGATGRLVVEQLLSRGVPVKAFVRKESVTPLPGEVLENPKLSVIEGTALGVKKEVLKTTLRDCAAVVSCLGHRGVRLGSQMIVRDSCQRVCNVIPQDGKAPTKFILMNTCLVDHPDGSDSEIRSFAQRFCLAAMRKLLPPHKDNELAAKYLFESSRSDLEWCVVRPGLLENSPDVTPYKTTPGIIFSMFNPVPVSRNNVADFMTTLVNDPESWASWKGKMPYIMSQID
mmetsp:Transcript_6292/g.11188  ORF Transcript_6292/g.11188 Transcript_6292/m.11188 type:complete len:241 (-) Transcript_6292:38-760(-)